MSQISTEDSGIFQLTKNAKTNNNVAGDHLVSLCVICTPSDVQLLYRCPKGPFILLQNITFQCQICHQSYLNVFKKNKSQGLNLVLTSPPPPGRKVLRQGLYFTPQVSFSKFLPKIQSYFSKLKMQKLTILLWAIISSGVVLYPQPRLFSFCIDAQR